MRDVPHIWEAWQSGGPFIGDYKPCTRVTVERAYHLNLSNSSPIPNGPPWNSCAYNDEAWSYAKSMCTHSEQMMGLGAWTGGVRVAHLGITYPNGADEIIGPSGGTPDSAPVGACYYRTSFTIATTGPYLIFAAADNMAELWLDGVNIWSSATILDFRYTTRIPVTLGAGDHCFAAKVVNYGQPPPKAPTDGNPTGLLLSLWTSAGLSGTWPMPAFDDSSWHAATLMCTVEESVLLQWQQFGGVAPYAFPYPHAGIMGPSSGSVMGAPTGDCYYRITETIAVTGDYWFYAGFDDSLEFYVDGQLKMSSTDRLRASSVLVNLTAGVHTFAAKVPNTTLYAPGFGNPTGVAVVWYHTSDMVTPVGTATTANTVIAEYPGQPVDEILHTDDGWKINEYPTTDPVPDATPHGEMVGTWPNGPARWYQRADTSQQIETEIPNIKSVMKQRAIKNDAQTATITLLNTATDQIGEIPELADQFGKPGFYSWSRGESQEARGRWGHRPNDWNSVLVPNALIRTYEGFGGHDKILQQAILDGNIICSGVWLVDEVTMNSAGEMQLSCRDMGKLLVDQQMFPPLVPLSLYPLKYHRYTYEQFTIPPLSHPGPVHDLDPVIMRYKDPADLTQPFPNITTTSSSDKAAGTWNASVQGHRPTDAFSGQTGGVSIELDTHSLSFLHPTPYTITYANGEGRSGSRDSSFWQSENPNLGFIEMATDGKLVNRIHVVPFDSWRVDCYISIMESGLWVDEVTQEQATVGSVNCTPGSGIPFVRIDYQSAFLAGSSKEIMLPRAYRADKIRLTFYQPAQSIDPLLSAAVVLPWGPIRIRQIAALMDHSIHSSLCYSADPFPHIGAENHMGYWQVRDDGEVFAFGDARIHPPAPANPSTTLDGRIVCIAATPTGQGYYLLDSFGKCVAYGDAQVLGDLYSSGVGNVVDMAVNFTGHGYWIMCGDGAIHPFGDVTDLDTRLNLWETPGYDDVGWGNAKVLCTHAQNMAGTGAWQGGSRMAHLGPTYPNGADQIIGPAIGTTSYAPKGSIYFRKKVTTGAGQHIICVAADNGIELYVDGVLVFSKTNPTQMDFIYNRQINITLTAGEHCIAAKVTNFGQARPTRDEDYNPTGFLMSLWTWSGLLTPDGLDMVPGVELLSTSATWKIWESVLIQHPVLQPSSAPWFYPAANHVSRIRSHPTSEGYWILYAGGQVEVFGTAVKYGESARPGYGQSDHATDLRYTRAADGYWILGGGGQVESFGTPLPANPGSGKVYPPAFLGSVNVEGVVRALIPSVETDLGYGIMHADGNIDVIGDFVFTGSVGSQGGQIRKDGNYKDYVDIIKELLLWAGFYLYQNPQPDAFPEIHGILESTGSFSTEDLPVELTDKVPVIHPITGLKESVGYCFYIDDEGGARFQTPNWWSLGNYDYDGNALDIMPEIDEKLQMLSYSVARNDTAARSEITISNQDPNPTMAGTPALATGLVVTRITPPSAADLKGMIKPAQWTNGVFIKEEEQKAMADLIAMHIWFARRVGKTSCVANPLIGLDDQVRIYERTTGETYVHYVAGVTTKHDLGTGEYTMDLETYWLGGSPYNSVVCYYSAAALPGDSGYLQLTSFGDVYAFGNARLWIKNDPETHVAPAVTIRFTATGEGYWTVDVSGKVISYGDAVNYGGLTVNETPRAQGGVGVVTDMAVTSTGAGYWLLQENGVVTPFGDAITYANGSHVGAFIGGQVADAVSLESDYANDGYWVLWGDGVVEAIGGLANHGSHLGDLTPASMATSVRRTNTSDGYWISYLNGPIEAYGDAADLGGAENDTPEGLARPTVDRQVWDVLPDYSVGATDYAVVFYDGTLLPLGSFPALGFAGGGELGAFEWVLATEADASNRSGPVLAVSDEVISLLNRGESKSAKNAVAAGFQQPTGPGG